MALSSRIGVAVLALLLAASAGAADAVTKNPRGKLMVEFLDTVFNQKKVKEGFDKYVGATYKQHNPLAPDGKEAAVEILSKWLGGMPEYHYDIKHVYVEGDIVVLHSHVTMKAGDRGFAVVDIFRLDKQKKAVEHWDVVQAIPEKPANDNTMF